MYPVGTEKYIFLGGPAHMQCMVGSGYYMQVPEYVKKLKATEIDPNDVFDSVSFNAFKAHTYKFREVNLMGLPKGFYVSETLTEAEFANMLGAFLVNLINIYMEA